MADTSDTQTCAATEINSNKVLSECCVDLSSSNYASHKVIVEDETERPPESREYSDISSKELKSSDFQTMDHYIVIESSEEGELKDEDEKIIKVEKVKQKTKRLKRKTKKHKRKCSSPIGKDIALSKRRKIERVVLNINANIQQVPYSSSLVECKTTEEGVTDETKSSKTRRNKHESSSLSDVTIENIKTKHCKCCKRSKKKPDSSENFKNETQNRCVTIETVSSNTQYQRESLQITTGVSSNSAGTGQSSPRNLQSGDRPIPECRRNYCGRNQRDYVPKYIEYCSQNIPGLEFISSDEFSISDRKLDSSFSLSDIESLISRSRKREGNSKQIETSMLRSTLHSKQDAEKKGGKSKSSEYFNVDVDDYVQFEKDLLTPIVNEISDSDVKLDQTKSETDSQKPPTNGKLRQCPIENLIKPISVSGRDNQNSLENKEGNCTDKFENHTSIVKPVGTVRPFRQCESKQSKKKKCKKATKKTTNNIDLPLTNILQNDTNKIDIKVGSILNDRYETCEIINKGSFSNIVRTMDKQNNSKVLLKILHQGKYSHMLYNLKLLNGLDPLDKYHCVHLKGQFFVSGHLALWLEDYSCSLRQRLECLGHAKGFPITTVQHLGRQLLIAVQFLTECGVLHANIRPEHLLLNSNDTNLKLTGFDGAIARNATLKTSYDQEPVNYQAPEIILKLKFDYSVDVWSAACVIFEMAAGKQLFAAGTENDVLTQITILSGHQFPNHMKIGEHFLNETITRKNVDHTTGKEDSKAMRKTQKRSLACELSAAYTHTTDSATVDGDKNILLAKLLGMVLHTMLLVQPNRRISVDFALLNKFFQVTP